MAAIPLDVSTISGAGSSTPTTAPARTPTRAAAGKGRTRTSSRASSEKNKSTLDAELDAIFDDIPVAGKKREVSERPVIVDKEINKRFRDDPVSAIRNSVQPYHTRSLLDDAREAINEVADAYERTEALKDELWSNRGIQFANKLAGMLPNDEVIERRTSIQPNPRPIARTPAGPATGGADDGATELIRGATGQETLAPAADRDEADRIRLQKNTRSVLGLPTVTGRLPLTKAAYSAIEDALAELVLRDSRTFKEVYDPDARNLVPVEARHFFVDNTAMTLFARLAAVYFQLNQEGSPNRYYLNSTNPRLLAKLQTAVDNVVEGLVYNRKSGGFEPVSTDAMLARVQHTARSMYKRRWF